MLMFNEPSIVGYYSVVIYFSEEERQEVFCILEFLEDNGYLTMQKNKIKAVFSEKMLHKVQTFILSLLEKKCLSLDQILTIVSRETNISLEELKSKTRKREIVEARQVYMALGKNLTKHTLADVGELVNRDHSTVLYAEKTVKDLPKLIKLYEEIENKLI